MIILPHIDYNYSHYALHLGHRAVLSAPPQRLRELRGAPRRAVHGRARFAPQRGAHGRGARRCQRAGGRRCELRVRARRKGLRGHLLVRRRVPGHRLAQLAHVREQLVRAGRGRARAHRQHGRGGRRVRPAQRRAARARPHGVAGPAKQAQGRHHQAGRGGEPGK